MSDSDHIEYWIFAFFTPTSFFSRKSIQSMHIPLWLHGRAEYSMTILSLLHIGHFPLGACEIS